MNRFADLIARRAGWVLLATFALSLLALAGVVDRRSGELRLSIDPSVDRLLPEGDEERIYYEHVRHVFGSDETVLVALASDDVFSLASLRAVARLSERLREIPGVRRVLSLATAPNLHSEGDALSVDSVTSVGLANPAAIERLRQDIRANPLYRGILVSEDERVTAIVLSFDEHAERGLRGRDLIARIESAAAEERGRGDVRSVWVTGSPILKNATSQALLHELSLAIPAIFALGACVLFLAFGSAQGVLLPLAAILLALLWTLGTLGWLGRPLNLVTALVPPLVITLGLAYAVHVLAEYTRSLPDETLRDARRARDHLRDALAGVALPVTVTGLTTLAGLLALMASPLAAVREFGQLAVLGTLYTVVLSLSFLPAALCFAWRSARSRTPPFSALLQRLPQRLGEFDLRHRRWILSGGVALLAAAALGALRIHVGTTYVGNFAPDAPVRVQYEAIDEAFDGTNPFYVVIETNLRDAFVHPDLLAQLEDLQQWLESQPEIGATTSIVDHLKLINRSVQGDDEHFALPESQALAKQLLAFGGGAEVDRFVDSLYHTTKITAYANIHDSASVSRLLERIERHVAALPLPMQTRITGSSVLLNETVERIASGQLQSIFAALAIIYLILSLLFNSARVGLVALLPNALPIAIYFGALGWLGIPLGPSTSLIACVVLGIAVDDTIHYMVRFNAEARRCASETKATAAALERVFRPISFTTLALCLGFLVLTTSELRNQVEFGALCAFTLGVAWLLDVTLTPALCAGVNIVTLWDVLRLDLGRDPQHTIPLFAGLSRRQARIFALTADIQTYAAGEVVRKQGDVADDMFVVLEGTLTLWHDRDGRRIDLRRATRGDLVGQVGFFLARHAATFEAVTDVRLLRFEDVDLELMLRRYPRIAARLLWNLNHSQASLFTGTTRALEDAPPSRS